VSGSRTIWIMWRPSTYEDVERAIGVLTETSTLDFKKALSKGPGALDLAKDCAAMAIEGGAIVVGVAEDGAARAASLEPIDLAGAPERVQQIVDAHVYPPLYIDLVPLRKNPGDKVGVLLIAIDPSPFVPHQVDDRYPARSGQTTRLLSEPEIERLYGRRRASLDVPASEGMTGFVVPEGVGSSWFVGVGRLRVFVRPVVAATHPATPLLKRPLDEATARAHRTIDERLPSAHPALLDWLSEGFEPRGTSGWQAGSSTDDFENLRNNRFGAANYAYTDSGLSFETTLSLKAKDGQTRVANEHIWAAELATALAVAGELFGEMGAAGSLLRCDLTLEGVDDAFPFASSRGRAFPPNQPRTPSGTYTAGRASTSRELATTPVDVALSLLARWFAAFFDEGTDALAPFRPSV
jgi:hypothetical protein